MANTIETLCVVILPMGKLTFEYSPCEETLSVERREIERRIYTLFLANHEKAFLAIGLIDHSLRFSPSFEYWRDLSASFIHEVLVDPLLEEKRGKISIALSNDDAALWVGRVPSMVGAEYVKQSFIISIWELFHRAFKEEVDCRTEPVEEIFRILSPCQEVLSHKVHFHLVENRRDSEAPFAFLATYSSSINTQGAMRHLPLSNALKEFENDTPRLVSLLSSVQKTAAASSLIKSLLDSGELFHPLRFSTAEAYQFLRDVPLFEQSGVLCRIPRWWATTPRKISVGLSIGDKSAGKLNAKALLSCTPLLHINGEEISFEEAQRILANYDGLALIKGKWIVVDKELLQKKSSVIQAGAGYERQNAYHLC